MNLAPIYVSSTDLTDPPVQPGFQGPYLDLLALPLAIQQAQDHHHLPLSPAARYTSSRAVSISPPRVTRILEKCLQLCHFESLAFDPYWVLFKTPWLHSLLSTLKNLLSNLKAVRPVGVGGNLVCWLGFWGDFFSVCLCSFVLFCFYDYYLWSWGQLFVFGFLFGLPLLVLSDLPPGAVDLWNNGKILPSEVLTCYEGRLNQVLKSDVLLCDPVFSKYMGMCRHKIIQTAWSLSLHRHSFTW